MSKLKKDGNLSLRINKKFKKFLADKGIKLQRVLDNALSGELIKFESRKVKDNK